MGASIVVVAACGSSGDYPTPTGFATTDAGASSRGGSSSSSSGSSGGDGGGDNRAGMVSVADGTSSFLIDGYEAKIVGGKATAARSVAPEVNVDYPTAKAACESAGKRLCTFREWSLACRGVANLLFGFQSSSTTPQNLIDVCDVARTTNNTPGSLPSLTGAHPGCKSDGYEIYDMIGNLSEWTIRGDGTPTAAGAAFYQPADGSTCDASLTASPGSTAPVPPSNKSTDIGFRCCAAP